MRVTRFVGVLVVLPMVRNPINGAAFQGQCSQQGEGVFHGLGALERPVSEQAVVAHADSQPSENRVQQDAEAHCRPSGLPENGDDAQVHRNDESGFDGLELVANGNGRRGRQRHTKLSHVVSSIARQGIRS